LSNFLTEESESSNHELRSFQSSLAISESLYGKDQPQEEDDYSNIDQQSTGISENN